ncbi:hypothetical protein HDU98_000651 [Podochytrium sp. JEL0797]|nr:hypothetical protein HDU98_000651 [Podochytrium sp. JEL0797]
MASLAASPTASLTGPFSDGSVCYGMSVPAVNIFKYAVQAANGTTIQYTATTCNSYCSTITTPNVNYSAMVQMGPSALCYCLIGFDITNPGPSTACATCVTTKAGTTATGFANCGQGNNSNGYISAVAAMPVISQGTTSAGTSATSAVPTSNATSVIGQSSATSVAASSMSTAAPAISSTTTVSFTNGAGGGLLTGIVAWIVSPRLVTYANKVNPGLTDTKYNIFVFNFWPSDFLKSWIDTKPFQAAGQKVVISAAINDALLLSKFVIANDLDSVDIDFEDAYSFGGEQWLITLLPSPRYIISHASQAPYFSPAVYPNGAYFTVDKADGNLIDFYNV